MSKCKSSRSKPLVTKYDKLSSSYFGGTFILHLKSRKGIVTRKVVPQTLEDPRQHDQEMHFDFNLFIILDLLLSKLGSGDLPWTGKSSSLR